MKLATLDDFVKLANFFYATIGIQPYRKMDHSKDHTFLASFIFYTGVINMNYVFLSEILYVIMALVKGENFLEATMTMSYVGFVLVGNIKIYFVYRQKDALTRFVNGLQNIFPTTRELQTEYNLKEYLRHCSRITISFSLLYMILIWTYNLFSIMQYLVYELWLNIREVGQTLPYYMYIPWNWNNHWSYYLLYAIQDFAGYTSAAGQISGDLLLTACATQMVMHYDYTAHKITNYQVKRGLKDLTVEEGYNLDMEFLRYIIRYHNNLLDLSDQLNNVFGISLLLNFVTSSFVICFVGFQVTIGATPETILKLLLFLFSSIAQVYLICYYGQQLIDSSSKIAEAVYTQNWSEADVRYKKMLVLIAERAQKPAVLKATSLVLVSRGTMTEIMQISYKFFALLRTMYIKGE
ncbi:odorant receptor 85c-like [Cochliomyia hominivorax]